MSKKKIRTILKVLQEQHLAIDILFAELILHDQKFMPSKSGQPWDAINQGNAVIQRLKMDLKQWKTI